MGRQPAEVWQFSQGMARGPCGLRVFSRWVACADAAAGSHRRSDSQQDTWRNAFVSTPLTLELNHPRPGCGSSADLTSLNFPEGLIQLYQSPVNGQPNKILLLTDGSRCYSTTLARSCKLTCILLAKSCLRAANTAHCATTCKLSVFLSLVLLVPNGALLEESAFVGIFFSSR